MMIEKLNRELRQEKYTGENRCEACTIVNLLITGVIASLISRKSKIGGYITIGISVVLIYFRGYLVPGTPALTKRYLPSSVLQLFGKEVEPNVNNGISIDESSSSTQAVNEESSNMRSTIEFEDQSEEPSLLTPEQYYLKTDILKPCDHEDDLCLTDSFKSAWHDELNDLADNNIDPKKAATTLGFDTDGESFNIENGEQACKLYRNDQTLGEWPSQSALIADIAASRVLKSQDERWDLYTPSRKGELLNSLRVFLKTCPTSNGEIVFREETVESCCSTHDVIIAVCDETDERIFEHPVPE